MKLIITLSLLGLLAFLAYWRLRPYIQAVRRMFRFVQNVRGMNAQEPQSHQERSSSAGQKLVRCTSCGTWIPSDRALMLKTSAFCSTDCVERAGTSRTRQRKSANL